MFESVLIANRGEIACRVMRTCKRLGVRTIAVFSDVDADAQHVRLADEAYSLRGVTARETYLEIEKLLAAARTSRAAAVHPGYGFLSENPAFADACRAAGLTFIGPSADAMRAMGLKDRAKSLMEGAGVPVVPGYHGADQSPQVLREAAREVGFPVLIKAVAGGGGKGMRRVDAPADFDDALAAARREAESAFGDGRVLVEKYVAAPRHIELQVFGDSHGHAIALHERDCSLQRRHQKVVEEAPAPGMPQAVRERLCEIAVRAARAIGYEGAGTIEMIADGSEGLSAERVYFMEMNTRLQVEHPVTEAITGFDLVEWQLRVAHGEPLPVQQCDVPLHGHAIEVRLYAEDPASDYLPQTGVLSALVWPAASTGVRIDTGVVEGDLVSMHYDPLLAKLIVHGPDRASALTRLRAALAQVEVVGPRTNLALLRRIAAHPAFIAGAVDTAFLQRHAADLVAASPVQEQTLRVLAAANLYEARVHGSARHPFDVADAFCPWTTAEHTFRVDVRGKREIWRVRAAADELAVTLTDDSVHTLSAPHFDGELRATLHGRRVRATLRTTDSGWVLTSQDETLAFSDARSAEHATGQTDELGALRAPMPGRVSAVLVGIGDEVQLGQPLVRLEAMKMEHTLRAPRAAIVAELSARQGAQVSEGSVLVSLRAKEE